MANTLEHVIGTTAYDANGSKLGKVKELYLDDRTSSPKWISIHTGLFGLSHSMVPLAGARTAEDGVQVQVTKEAVKAAPHLDADEKITAAEEAELTAHYGLSTHPAETGLGNEAERPGAAGERDFAGTAPKPDGRQVVPPTAPENEQLADQLRERHPDAGQHNQTPTVGERDSLVRSEERLDVGTERTTTGTARLRKYTVTEQQTVTVPVTHEEVRVEREPITDATTVRGEQFVDADREVTLHEDQLVVNKESVPVERVRLGVQEVTEDKTITEQVRKEQIDTEGVPRTAGDVRGDISDNTPGHISGDIDAPKHRK